MSFSIRERLLSLEPNQPTNQSQGDEMSSTNQAKAVANVKRWFSLAESSSAITSPRGGDSETIGDVLTDLLHYADSLGLASELIAHDAITNFRDEALEDIKTLTLESPDK